MFRYHFDPWMLAIAWDHGVDFGSEFLRHQQQQLNLPATMAFAACPWHASKVPDATKQCLEMTMVPVSDPESGVLLL